MTTLKIGIVGFGKIARDQHLPAITATNGLELVAVADPNTGSDMVPAYPTLEAMILVHPEIGAVSLCQPPSARFAAAIVASISASLCAIDIKPASNAEGARYTPSFNMP